MLRLASILCGAVGLMLYVSTLRCGFCYDDRTVLLENKDILPTSPWTNLLWDDFWGNPINLNTSHKSYRPLCVATFRLNYLVHGLEPMGYHLVNVVLHAVVCYLYVQLCGAVFTEVWPALIAGLLFAAHPIHTEAVAGIVGRADLLSALFFLLSLLQYFNTLPSNGDNDASKGCSNWIYWSIFYVVFSVLSKEQGLTALGVCLAYDILHQDLGSLFAIKQGIFKNCHHKTTCFLKRAAILTSSAAVLLILRLRLQKGTPKFTETDNEGLSLDAPYRQLHWAYLIAVNTGLLLNPSQLLHDYRMNAIPLVTSLWDTRNLCTAATFVGLALLGKTALSHRYYSVLDSTWNSGLAMKKSMLAFPFGLSLLILPFLPASNLFFPVGFVVAERVLYLPSMGFCMLVAFSAYQLIKSKHYLISTCAKVCLIVVIATHSVRTVTRNNDWNSRLSLYASVIRLYPSNGHMLVNSAKEFRELKDYRRAELAYRHSMAVAPYVVNAYVNFGSMLKEMQRFKEAEEVFLQAIPVLLIEEDTKNLAQVYTALCNMIVKNHSRVEEASHFCQKAADVSTSYTAHNSLGVVHLIRGQNKLAVESFKRAALMNTSSVAPDFNLALAYINLGEDKLAVESLERVLEVDKSHTEARKQLQQLMQEKRSRFSSSGA